jgi:response regulator RpfG family c-di-GMP phosphodiesterase
MAATPAYTILCVDDEVGILRALNRRLRRAGYRVLIAESGEGGLEILRTESVNLIISDQKMPGMQGNEFLRLSRKLRPDAVRIMLTAYADIKAATAAINQGSIYKFLLKPWDEAELLETIKAGLKQQDLVLGNRRLTVRLAKQYKKFKQVNETLKKETQNFERDSQSRDQRIRALEQEMQGLEKERNSRDQLIARLRQKEQSRDHLIALLRHRTSSGYPDFIKTMVALLGLRSLDLANHSARVAEVSHQVAERISKNQLQAESIGIAGRLHDIGKIGLPEKILVKPLDQLDPKELGIMQRHPVLGQSVLQHLEGLDDILEMIRSHHENFDGSGYPEGLTGVQIPAGARIIAVVNAYDNMCNSKRFGKQFTTEEAANQLEAGKGKLYDPEIVDYYLSILLETSEQSAETEVPRGKSAYFPETEGQGMSMIKINELQEGMVLARDLHSLGKALLLPADTVITSKHLARFHQFTFQ